MHRNAGFIRQERESVPNAAVVLGTVLGFGSLLPHKCGVPGIRTGVKLVFQHAFNRIVPAGEKTRTVAKSNFRIGPESSYSKGVGINDIAQLRCSWPEAQRAGNPSAQPTGLGKRFYHICGPSGRKRRLRQQFWVSKMFWRTEIADFNAPK